MKTTIGIDEKRQCVSLTDAPWRFCPDPHEDGEQLGFFKQDFDARLWREVTVPSCFEAVCPNLEFYEGICWYRHAFAIPPDWRGRRIVLRFGAVNTRAKVWLNGEPLGENLDGFLPFEFDIQTRVRWTGCNTLAVSADNRHHEGDVPGMHVGWRGQGGILRDVCLHATGHAFVDTARVTATPGEEHGDMEIRLRIRNLMPDAAPCTIAITVRDVQGQICREMHSDPVTIEAGGTCDVSLQDALPGARPWSPSSPVRYFAEVCLRHGDEIMDEAVIPFGFRRIEATPEGLLLNGEKIFLTGFNRHEDSPHTAMAVDRKTTRDDLEMMKEAGANFVRLCHYPHDPAELDMCDELGLLAFAEIPLYFWNDREEGKRTQAARAKTAARQLERMIARDGNHPSLIVWSVSNETPENEPDVVADNAKLIRLARTLDPTRLCVHVSNHWSRSPHFEEDDVICVNYYPSHESPGGGHSPATFDPARSATRWRNGLEAVHRVYPEKPILVTEFGYCSFAGTQGHAFGEDEHARVLEAEFAAMDAPYVCGATVWCWADHAWPAGRFRGGLSISPYGVLTRDRHKLRPFRTARSLFRAKQKLDGPPPQARSTSVTMIRAHMRDIPDAPFPTGYGIRPMSEADVGLWTDIQRDAETHINITDDLFRHQFGDDMPAIGRRCFIVTDPRGLGVGTISAWYDRDFRGEDCGRIHWVCVRPSCQGKGVGKAALSYAMKALAQWHERCYLVTSTERETAIGLYLNFGFVPDLQPLHAREVWEELRTRLDHPALAKALA